MKMKAIFDQFKIIKKEFFLSDLEKKFIAFNEKESPHIAPASAKKLKILIQTPENYYYLIFFSSIVRSLKKDFQLELSWANIFYAFRYKGKLAKIKTTQFYQRRWKKLYRSNGGKIVYSQMFRTKDISEEVRSDVEKFWNGLSSKQGLEQFTYDGILIGDLIYDSYLRFKPAPTVDLKDLLLKTILLHTANAVKKANALFSKNHYDYYLTSYASYAHHGVLVRAALKAQVKVLSFGCHDLLSKAIAPDFPNHMKNHMKYLELFNGLSENEKKEARNISKLNLEKRFAGEIDFSTIYMTKSAYQAVSTDTQSVFKATGKKRVVIFLHCFFDSPHIFRDMVYSDFYEWITQTLQFVADQKLNEKYDFYVKPHPNGIPGNEEIIEGIKSRFSGVTFLPKSVSNKQLIQEGFDLALTVYGTLGHEFPYFGIRVLNAGDNPHVNYDFSAYAKTKKQYEDYLSDIDSIPALNESSRQQILDFYYMHNFYLFPGRLPMDENAVLISLFSTLKFPAVLAEYIKKSSEDPVYLNYIDGLIYRSLKEVL